MIETRVERMLPLYEGKMGHQYDHRAASFTGVGDTDILPNPDHDPAVVALPRYWVRQEIADDRLRRREWGSRAGLLGFRRVARNTDERTCISAVVPWGAASYGWILSAGPEANALALLLAEYNSFVFDFVLRQFLSQPSIPQGTFEQLPTVPLQALAEFSGLSDPVRFIRERVATLTVTSNDLVAFGAELDLNSVSRWNETSRSQARAEIDALMFHLYGIERDDLDYIMETFPIVKRKDEAAHGEYRTKRLILEVCDQMTEAIRTGASYTSPFDESAR